MSAVEVVFKLAKEDQQLVFAEVYCPDTPDSDGEFMDAEGVQEAAYRFMKTMKLDSVDTQHNNELVPGCCVVESFIARKGDPDFIEGAWVVGMHIDHAETWDKIKKGEINGFSIEAMVNKTLTEVEIIVPPFLNGKTFKADDGHAHSFSVSYNDQGVFLGGETGITNGHRHAIRKGTVTEVTNGHSHRFSHVEGISLKEV